MDIFRYKLILDINVRNMTWIYLDVLNPFWIFMDIFGCIKPFLDINVL